jgi:hypothetical protein
VWLLDRPGRKPDGVRHLDELRLPAALRLPDRTGRRHRDHALNQAMPLPAGHSVLCEDPQAFRVPEGGAVIDFEPDSSAASVERRIVDVLGAQALGSSDQPV